MSASISIGKKSTADDIVKSIDELHTDMKKVFNEICETGRAECAEHFLSLFGKKCCEIDHDTFIEICSLGHYDMVKFLVYNTELPRGVVNAYNNKPFFEACENDRLEIAQLLDVAACMNFYEVCIYGGELIAGVIDANRRDKKNNRTIQWVIDRFEITPEDIALDLDYLEECGYTFGGTYNEADALFQTKSAAKLS
jgi:hypothetical protein